MKYTYRVHQIGSSERGPKERVIDHIGTRVEADKILTRVVREWRNLRVSNTAALDMTLYAAQTVDRLRGYRLRRSGVEVGKAWLERREVRR